MLKKLIVKLFLKNEVNALKIRLSEASHALKKIEVEAIALSKDASADAQKLGATVLRAVLSSADSIRAKEANYVHAWEEEAYRAYKAVEDPLATYNYAHTLIEQTKLFF